jgi:hypothetical protein
VLESYQFGEQRPITTSKFFIPRHLNFFYGYCFSCEKFGHKAVSCRIFRHKRNVRTRFNKSQKTKVQNSFNNAFSPLLNDLECHICNNFGHKASEYRRKLLPIFRQDKQVNFTKVWMKKNKNEKNCGLALYAKNQENQWYIDNGYS